MKPTRYNFFAIFLCTVGCIGILLGVIVLFAWIGGGTLGYVQYILMLSATLVNGLILSGLAAGILIGILSGILTKRLNPIIKQHFL